MGMDDAVGTITQVLSVIDRTLSPYKVIRRAPENALTHTSALGGSPQPASFTTCVSSHYLTAQNFRIILRSSCIVKKRLAF